ncbi:MAG: hypothetical protein Q4C56_09020 [Peptococcaceae bacterium]|nr:hypothetical protein [Peptococcaceae bacterium]
MIPVDQQREEEIARIKLFEPFLQFKEGEFVLDRQNATKEAIEAYDEEIAFRKSFGWCD